MMKGIKVVPLSFDNLAAATELASVCFPDDAANPDNSPYLGFVASLEPEKYHHLYLRDNLVFLRYYILVDTTTNTVIGTTGLYKLSTDPITVVWLGWYCIDQNYRGKGFGKYLLQWTIDKAKSEGFDTLRLYTSDDSYHEVAQKVYEQFGFVEFERKDRDRSDLIYKELKMV